MNAESVALAHAVQYSARKEMDKHPLRFRYVFFGGLVLISLGFASSVGLRPVEILAPMVAVVGGLAVLTTMVGTGPRAFL